MKINFINKKKILFSKEDKKLFKESVNNILKTENKKLISLNVVFCSDEFIKEYNKKYLDHDYETDIITFYDFNEDGLMEGELLISVDTVKKNSDRYKVSFINEIRRVLIHGVLHLCGYNDGTEKEKILMKKKENYFLKNL